MPGIMFAIILGIGLLLQGQATELPEIDLYDIEQGKAIIKMNNSLEAQNNVNRMVQSVTGFADRTSVLEFNGFCVRIPTPPTKIQNQWLDTTIQDVFLYLDPAYEPVLQLFDVRWPSRYWVRFSYDARPFLKEIGVWEMVKSSYRRDRQQQQHNSSKYMLVIPARGRLSER